MWSDGVMHRFIGFIILLALVSTARGQTAYSYRYWFDNNLSTLHGGAASGDTTIEVDISALGKGFVHALHFQSFNAAGEAMPVRTQYFFVKKNSNTEGATARYWFDNDETTAQATSTVNGLINLDISQMRPGMHAIHYQMFNAAGEASPVHTEFFFFANIDTQGVTARYWFDYDETTVQTTETVNGLIDLDISQMALGVHALHFQTFSATGEASPVRTQFFLIEPLEGDINADNSVTVADVTTLVNIILGQQTEYDSNIADVDGNGILTIDDLNALVNKILKKTNSIQQAE